jgi:hypothetical protein
VGLRDHRGAGMTEPEEQALALYAMIRATGGDRPTAFQTLEQLERETSAWRATNTALAALRQAPAEALIAFLHHSFEWLRAESAEFRSFGVCHTLSDAIGIALARIPKPWPPTTVLRLLSEFRQDSSMARLHFPFPPFLAMLSRDDVTEEIRTELRKLSFQFAPSPTGKIDARTAQTRDLIAGLMHIEGEKQLDPGRGPWSQNVFDEIKRMDEITRAGWEALLEHGRSLEQAAPGKKWAERAREVMAALGETEATSTMLRWLALGPTPGQPREARSPIEDSAYQRGIVWCLSFSRERAVAVAVADFTLACLRKVPMMGAVSQKVGFAGVQVLGAMECMEAVSQLSRLRARVKYSVARRLIEKSLGQAAARNGLTVEDLEDMCVEGHGLDATGTLETSIGDVRAASSLQEDGRVGVTWQGADGGRLKAAPSNLKKAFPREVRAVAERAKQLEEAYLAQRVRLESLFVSVRSVGLDHWRRYFIEHPLLGRLGRRLIWVFSNDQGWECAGWSGKGEPRDARGEPLDIRAATKVRLWHPLATDGAEVAQWREQIFASGLRQPFRQAFREFYQVTSDERHTRMYSNRFAGVLMRQHQLASLCRARGWDYRLMGSGFDGYNVPTRSLPRWSMQAEFHVDLPADRDEALRDSAVSAQSGSGINLIVGSDQVRFYRDRREVAIEDVPAIVYSEVMRDVDLFTSVCAVGEDENWVDQGERGLGRLSRRPDLEEISSVMALRAEMLSRILPHATIAERCRVEKTHLEVRGQLGTYRIGLGWAATLLITDGEARPLRVPPDLLDSVALDLGALPIELDHRTETVLRTAYVLADDWNIHSPDFVRQLTGE